MILLLTCINETIANAALTALPYLCPVKLVRASLIDGRMILHDLTRSSLKKGFCPRKFRTRERLRLL